MAEQITRVRPRRPQERDGRVPADRFIGVKEACDRLCCGRTTLYTHYIAGRRLTPVKRGPRRTLFLERQVDQVIRDQCKAAGVRL